MSKRPPPSDVFVGIASASGKIDAVLTVSLIKAALAGYIDDNPYIHIGNSDVQAARITIMNMFLRSSKAPWLMMIDDDIAFQMRDWDLLWEGDEAVVCAQYRKKIWAAPFAPTRLPYSVVHFGLGFCRVHRSVFEAMQALTTHEGIPWVQQGMYAGDLIWNFSPAGITAAGDYRAEDHGFWQLVHLTKPTLRVETRTRLAHMGTCAYHYEPGREEDPGYR
jgi:hypothetical protein